jgi:hypothetical protein
MYIRETDKAIQLIRTNYDPARKRGVQTVVAKLETYATTLSPETCTLLTLEEQAQVADWLKARASSKQSTETRQRLDYAHHSLAALVAAVPGLAEHPDADQVATRIWEGMAALQSALRKSGHRRPKAPATPKAAAQ